MAPEPNAAGQGGAEVVSVKKNMTLNTVCLPSSGHNCHRQTLPIVCIWRGCGWRYSWEGRKRKARLEKKNTKTKILKYFLFLSAILSKPHQNN